MTAGTWWTAAGVIVALSVGVGGVIVAVLALPVNTRKSNQEDGEWKGRVNTLLEQIRNDLDELRHIMFDRLGIPLIVSKSPLRLTKLGRTVSVEVGASAWVARVTPVLKDQIEGKDAYEIQDLCFGYVENTNQYLDDERRAIQSTAYHRGLEAKEIRRVLAIELRDQLLKEAGLEAPVAPDED